MNGFVHFGEEDKSRSRQPPVQDSRGRDEGSARLSSFTHTVNNLSEQHFQISGEGGGRMYGHAFADDCGWLVVADTVL